MTNVATTPAAKKRVSIPAFKPVKVTPALDRAMKEARMGFMAVCPFLSHLYFAETKEVWTLDVNTAATDGRRIAVNPEFLAKLRPAERIFVLAHEVDHVLCRHPQRFKHYAETTGPDGEPFDWQLANQAADYTINARLTAAQVGKAPAKVLLRPDITGDMLWEDVYKLLKQEQKKQGGKGQPGQEDGQGEGQGDGWGHDGSSDVIAPSTDPSTGRDDVMSDMAHKEAVAQARAHAKGVGKMPAGYDKIVDELLEQQVPWAEHVRLTMAGRLGRDQETWSKVDRRRLALNPMIVMPGRRGYGCDTLVVGLDTSGSIYADPKSLAVFFAEMGGIIADLRPRRLIVIQCDAAIHQVDDVRSLDEVQALRQSGVKGGGGTDMTLIEKWVEENNVRPDMLVIMTDGYTPFSPVAPAFPMLWCMTTDVTAPYGDHVRVKI